MYFKPIVNKIFNALNKIFWLLNSKIGIYDQEYLNSLYRVWKKNKGRIPKMYQNVNNSKKENKSFTEGYAQRKRGRFGGKCFGGGYEESVANVDDGRRQFGTSLQQRGPDA